MRATITPARFRVPHWGWLALVTIAFVGLAVAMSVWLPYHREQQAVARIELWGGSVHGTRGGPDWLRSLVGDEHMNAFDRVTEVQLVGVAIADAELVCLADLPHLETLNCDGTPVGDRSLACLCGLKRLTSLCLSRSEIADAGLAHVRRLSALEFLNLNHTNTTDIGLEHLQGLVNLRDLDFVSDPR